MAKLSAGSTRNRLAIIATTAAPAIVRKNTWALTNKPTVRKATPPMFPYAPAMPAIWPLTRFFTSGTMENTAPAPDWTKNEQTMQATTASAHGQAAPIVESST